MSDVLASNCLNNGFNQKPSIEKNQQQPDYSLQIDENLITTSSSIIEFLNQEQNCANLLDNESELDIDSIFEEVNRLSDDSGNFYVFFLFI